MGKGVAECGEEDVMRAVGVIDYVEGDMSEKADEVVKYDIPLATKHCKYRF